MLIELFSSLFQLKVSLNESSNRRSNVPLHVRKKHQQDCSHGDVVVLEDEMNKYKKMFPNTEVRSRARISS